jgi:CheY-like chemotaxis protein
MWTQARNSSTSESRVRDLYLNPSHPAPLSTLERKLRVLLVEDAPFLRYAFGRLLRMEGFDVKEVNDGQEALDCLASFRPELVLTDLMMPVMDGVELISRIRADPDYDSVPVVAITADITDRGARLARQAGAVDVITKPIDLASLLERLRVLVH